MFTKKSFLAPLSPSSHKFNRGIVGILAGSDDYPGAAVLCVGGARRGGVGYVKFIRQSKISSQLIYNYFPDVVQIPEFKGESFDAIVVGPGNPKIMKIPQGVPVILDSSAIASLDIKRNPITILTPHEGELKYLGYSLTSRTETAQRIADDLGVILVLKGSHTIVAAPGLAQHIDLTGGAELSTAGSGDILAGLIGAMIASWKPTNLSQAQEITFKAVQMHSRAGKKARKRKNPVVATDILEVLPSINL